MGRNGAGSYFKGIDGFAKVKLKINLLLSRRDLADGYVDYRRGEKIIVDMNYTFPSSTLLFGEHQNDCGSCYGGEPGSSGCCNSCEEVRESYVRRGWSFDNPDGIDQCVEEHWSERIKEQSNEGCNVNGQVKVNKVIGNFHLSPGRSFQTHAVHVHDLVPYLRSGNLHDFGHIIHRFAFLAENQPLETLETMKIKSRLGIINPLDGLKAHTEESNYMFQYFLKVVGTEFRLKDGRVIKSHQYSVTQHERDLAHNSKPKASEMVHLTSHGSAGVPGVFFNYEISPMQVIHKEFRQSFAHFATSTCAIVGGVLTVAGLIDSFVYGAQNRIKGNRDGFNSHSRTGKFL
ncbi:endoplasmic reticulum vesicle transporter-domain-containing protein [Phakopsora pachyrhizi]|nr:endoplasmic reticulum vesicle transporter-domain-containing protein [Phakopsora pachyrhizi]